MERDREWGEKSGNVGPDGRRRHVGALCCLHRHRATRTRVGRNRAVGVVMEPSSDMILEFECRAESGDGAVSPFVLRVSAPEYDDARGYFCRVHCPYFRETPFLIFGVDEAQARQLSIEFIERLLAGETRLVDDDGRDVALPTLPSPPA